MANKYLDFISDEHLLECIDNLYKSYLKAKAGFTKKKLYSNKLDTFKLTFDAKFNDLSEEMVLQNEMLRQVDKSINNSIGTFHEETLGGIKGYEVGNLSGYDIKAIDNTLFADIKNKHNTMNSSAAESLFQKLARYADSHKKAKCYWVQILAKNSFCDKWSGDINGKEYSHSRVYKISGDKFYALLTGKDKAFFELYKVLPKAISDYLSGIEHEDSQGNDSAVTEVKSASAESNRGIFDQITFDNFSYYMGFDEL